VDNSDIQKIENWLQKAINADQKNVQTWNLGKGYAFSAELFKRKNKNSVSQDFLFD
jgi:hypothetical protein